MSTTTEKAQVIKAINDLGRRVTAADVATKTGLPLHKATTELNQVASETRGHLQVSTAGDIAYTFDPGFETTYLAQGMRKFLQDAWDKIFKVVFFLVRISFGIGLILSFLIVIGLIIALMLAGRGNSDSDSDSGGGGFSMDFLDYMLLRDFFFWNMYPAYTTYGYNDYDRPYELYDRSTTRIPETNNNFVTNCFSFLFGDGSPNLNLDERKWQLIAQVIKANNGVVTAEQLAPYTGADPKNEDGVLPVLVRFEGKPEVTSSGNILYTFPSLQVTAKSQALSALPSYLQEFNWLFTAVPSESLVPVYILAGLNFIGSWFLFSHIHSAAILFSFAGLIKLLVIYGTLFLLVPAVRWAVLKWKNGQIDARNAKRQEYAALLRNPSAELLRKFGEAKRYRIGEKNVRTDDVAYTTDKDVLDQEFDETTNKPVHSDASHPDHISHPDQPKQISFDPQSAENIDHVISLKEKDTVEEKVDRKKRQWKP
jgi:hypothetical protein